MTEVIARREFSPLYIWLDTAFLVFFCAKLIMKKKYVTVTVGLIFGLVYMAVDYGIFHLLCGARSISEGHNLFLVLLWMSLSYGFTNFTWIWLWISKDKHLFEWSLLIVLWWFCAPLISDTFSSGQNNIVIQRTTGAYHGYMALILIAGYAGLVIYNLFCRTREKRINIPWLLAIGVLVQFSWEACLLIGGIRSAGFESLSDKLRTLVVNSLLETNLGMPYIYLIFIYYSARYTEQMKKRENAIGFTDRIAENNSESVSC